MPLIKKKEKIFNLDVERLFLISLTVKQFDVLITFIGLYMGEQYSGVNHFDNLTHC